MAAACKGRHEHGSTAKPPKRARGRQSRSLARLDRETFTKGKAWGTKRILRPQPLKTAPRLLWRDIADAREVARPRWNLALSRQPLANCAKATRKYRAELANLGMSMARRTPSCARYLLADSTNSLAEAVPEIMRFWQLATDNTGAARRFRSRYDALPNATSTTRRLTIKRLDNGDFDDRQPELS